MSYDYNEYINVLERLRETIRESEAGDLVKKHLEARIDILKYYASQVFRILPMRIEQ